MVAEVYKFAIRYPHSYIRAHTAHRDACTGQMEWQVSVADQTGRHTFVLIQAIQYGPIKTKTVNEAAT